MHLPSPHSFIRAASIDATCASMWAYCNCYFSFSSPHCCNLHDQIISEVGQQGRKTQHEAARGESVQALRRISGQCRIATWDPDKVARGHGARVQASYQSLPGCSAILM